jgi:hypothetical protein
VGFSLSTMDSEYMLIGEYLEMGAGMPEEERKKLAARAVKEMLRSL